MVLLDASLCPNDEHSAVKPSVRYEHRRVLDAAANDEGRTAMQSHPTVALTWAAFLPKEIGTTDLQTPFCVLLRLITIDKRAGKGSLS